MIARGEYRNKSADKIRGSGYAVESLEAALGPLHRQTLAVLNRSLIFLGVMRDFGIYIVRGLLSFQSRRFELSRSSIQFIGAVISAGGIPRIEAPDLEIKSDRRYFFFQFP